MSARSRWVRAAAALIGVLAGLAIAEGALRIWAWLPRGEERADLWSAELRPPPAVAGDCADVERQAALIDLVQPSEHPDLIYELRPETRTCFRGAEVEINRNGVRSDGSPLAAKDAATFRILLLGDSHTFGWGVEWPDTFGERLERLLSSAAGGAAIEVVNAGVPGYNTALEAAWLEHRGLALEPDCVLVLFVGNDLGLPTFLLEPEPRGGDSGSHLLTLARRFRRSKPSFRIADQGLTDFVSALNRERVPEAYRHMVGFSGYRQALRRIARLAAREGIEVVNAADYGSHGGVANRKAVLSRLMANLGIVEVELEWPEGEELRISREDPHFNAAGQAEYARRLARGLLEAGACLPAAPERP